MYGSNWARFGAVAELAVMLASLTRIEVPPGKVPRKTSAPSLPVKDCMEIDTLGKVNIQPLLSTTKTAPFISDRFFIDTLIFGFAATIAVTLMLITMLPFATTFMNTTSEHEALIISFASGIVELVTMQGITAKASWIAKLTTRTKYIGIVSLFFDLSLKLEHIKCVQRMSSTQC